MLVCLRSGWQCTCLCTCLYVGIVSRKMETRTSRLGEGRGEEGKRRKEEGGFEDIQQ
jgi:hypothetical protein